MSASSPQLLQNEPSTSWNEKMVRKPRPKTRSNPEETQLTQLTQQVRTASGNIRICSEISGVVRMWCRKKLATFGLIFCMPNANLG